MLDLKKHLKKNLSISSDSQRIKCKDIDKKFQGRNFCTQCGSK